jgi:YD repeat-containing protein
MAAEITVPDEFAGSIMGDLNSRRGRIQGMDNKGGNTVVKAEVPMSEMFVFLLLVGCSILLLRFHRAQRPVKVELLTLNYQTPAWDGSYPRVVISPFSTGADALKFTSSISLKKPTVRHDSPVNEFEVALDSGRFVLRQTDIFVPDVMPLVLTRTYNTWRYFGAEFGAGASHPYGICQSGNNHPYTYMELALEDGRKFYFPRIPRGTGYEDAVYQHYATSSEFYQAKWAWNGTGWTLDFRDGRKFLFPDSYQVKNCAQAAPIEMRDGEGHRIRLLRDKVRNLEKLISPSGHTITFKYDALDRIIEAKDDAGHIRSYSYNGSGYLEIVSDDAHLLYRFDYDEGLMTRIINGNRTELLRNWYDNRRISKQKLSNGDVYRYDYLFDKKYNVVETTVTPPSGEVKRFLIRNGIASAAK